MCADVTSPNLHISEGSVDLIFSNWLLMYLSDKEVSFCLFYAYNILSIGFSWFCFQFRYVGGNMMYEVIVYGYK